MQEIKQIQSTAKIKLIELLKSTVPGKNEIFTFVIPGTIADGMKFVQRMRVELSRIRCALKASGTKLKQFKLYTVAITPVAEPADNQNAGNILSGIIKPKNWVEIKLRRTTTESQAISWELTQLIKVINQEDHGEIN